MEMQVIKVDKNNPNGLKVWGRELHEGLEVKTPYTMWFTRMCEYGFSENTDFTTVHKNVIRSDGTTMPQEQVDHQITIDMAKELCMLQRTEKGKYFRRYFIECEKAWNSPEAIMARALQLANSQLETALEQNKQLEMQIETNKPKVVFADAVSVSNTSILVGDLAKLIKQNGIDIGANRLFAWLRENGYLISRKGADYNSPTQKSMDLHLFEIKETVVTHSDGHTTISKTPKVTGKGQVYFINKFVGKLKTTG